MSWHIDRYQVRLTTNKYRYKIPRIKYNKLISNKTYYYYYFTGPQLTGVYDNTEDPHPSLSDLHDHEPNLEFDELPSRFFLYPFLGLICTHS